MSSSPQYLRPRTGRRERHAIRRQTQLVAIVAAAVLGLVIVLPSTDRHEMRPHVAAAAQTVPVQESIDALERRAYAAFDSEDYARALPLMEQLAGRLKDHYDRLALLQQDISTCESKLAAASPQAVVPARKRHAPPKLGEVRDLDVRELGNFDYNPQGGGTIPDDVRQMDGARVRLRGFMVPVDQAEKVTHFALVPSLFNCCFGLPPSIQHTIMVTCPPGKAVAVSQDQVDVEGVLRVYEDKDDGYVVSLFQMTCTGVMPVAHQR